MIHMSDDGRPALSAVDTLDVLNSMLEPLSIMRAVRDENQEIVDFEWVYINQAGANEILLPIEALMGHRLLEVLPEHRDGLFDVYKDVVETGQPFAGKELGYDDNWGTQDVIPRIYDIRATKVDDGFAVSWNDVTEAVERRHMLADSNQELSSYKKIVDLAGMGIWVLDGSGCTTYANHAMGAMLGVEAAELVGRSITEFMDEPARQEARTRLAVRAQGVAESHEFRFQRTDGTELWTMVSATPLMVGSQFQGSIGLVTDISVERAERLARERAESLYVQATEGAAIGQALVALDGTFTHVNPALCSITGYPAQELVGRTFQEITLADDLESDVHQAQALAAGEIPSYEMDKRYVRKDGQIVWVRLHGSVVRDADDVPVMFAAQIADIQAEKKAEEALIESERAFRLLAENASDVVVQVDDDGKRTWVSDSVTEFLGWSPEEYLAMSDSELFHPEDLQRLADLRGEFASSGAQVLNANEFRLLHKGGHWVWISARSRQLPRGGRIASMRIVDREIRARLALQASQAEFQLLAENASDAVLRLSVDGTIEWVSPSVSRLLGWHPDSLIGVDANSLIHPNNRDELRANRQAVDEGKPRNWHTRVRREDGSYCWVFAAARRITGPEGEGIGRIICWTNAESEMRTRRALSESERQYRLIADNAGDMVMRIRNGRFTWLSPSVAVVLGHDPDSLVGSLWSELVHPDEHDIVVDSLGSVESGRDVLLRARLNVRHHGWVWTEAHASPYYDDAGAIDGAIVIGRDISNQVEAEQAAQDAAADLAFRSSHDLLTGLRNRAEVFDFLERSLAGSEPKQKVGVLFIDVDRFKEINDGISHAAGDIVLTQIADQLSCLVRPTDLIGRLGGDEFAAVLTGLSNKQDAIDTAERIRSKIAGALYEAEGRSVRITLSIGVALARRSSTAASLLSEADAALYRAKGSGRNRWEVADEAMRTEATRRVDIVGNIRGALESGDFHAWFQPIVNLQTGDVIGYESLARWTNSDGSTQDAVEFIGIAEESGLICDIGRAVISEAVARLAELPADQFLAVNASPTEVSAPGFAEELLRQINRRGANPHQLVVEITEQSLLNLGPSSRSGLAALHAAGIGIHVDDFGTGYSSLSTLRDYPITGIKLDRSFTTQLTMDQDGPAARLVSGIGELAQRLGLQRIAEGVETSEQARMLIDLGWTQGQGWLFGAATPPANYPTMLDGDTRTDELNNYPPRRD